MPIYGDTMTLERIGDWMPTYSGKKFWLLDPRPEEIELIDIAHPLSLMCRYNGHINYFYSVAQHSVIVSYHCTKKAKLYGLMHDAAEAYAGDVIRPLKKLLPNYQEIEQRILDAICVRFDIKLTPDICKEVKYWDDVLLATEVRQLSNFESNVDWKLYSDRLDMSLVPTWQPDFARDNFIREFNYLNGKR